MGGRAGLSGKPGWGAGQEAHWHFLYYHQHHQKQSGAAQGQLIGRGKEREARWPTFCCTQTFPASSTRTASSHMVGSVFCQFDGRHLDKPVPLGHHKAGLAQLPVLDVYFQH